MKADLAQHVGRGRIVQKMSCLQPGEVHRASDTHDCLACFGRKAETPIGAGDPVAQFQMVFLALHDAATARSEEHTSELKSLMRNSYAVFCVKQKTNDNTQT